MSNRHSSVQENGTPSLYISDFNFERSSKLTEKAVYTNQKPFLILHHRVTPHLAIKIVTFFMYACSLNGVCHVTSSNSQNQLSWFFAILGPKVFEKNPYVNVFFWFGSDNIIISWLDIQSKFQMFTLFSGCHIEGLRSSNMAAPY